MPRRVRARVRTRAPGPGPARPPRTRRVRADARARGRRGRAAAAAGAPGGAEPSAPEPHFRRDRRHQMFGGVCSGLGRQYDMDPVIFRITLAVLSATGGIGLIFYGFAWLFVPYDDEEENQVRRLLTGRVDGHTLAAVLFALVGCGVFLSMLSNDGVLSFAVILSLLLGGAAYWSRRRGTERPDPIAAQAAADAPPEPQAPPVPAAYPSWWREPIVKDGTYVGGRAICGAPRTPATWTSPPPSASASAPAPVGASGTACARRRRARRGSAGRAGSAAGCSCSPCSRPAWASA